MAVIYPDALKATRMTAVRTAIDAGGAAGKLEICSASYATVLATIALGYSGAATATISGPLLTFAGFPRSDAAADATGVAAIARIRTSANVDVITGLTVGMVGADINIDSLAITVGQTVTINSATLTHA